MAHTIASGNAYAIIGAKVVIAIPPLDPSSMRSNFAAAPETKELLEQINEINNHGRAHQKLVFNSHLSQTRHLSIHFLHIIRPKI